MNTRQICQVTLLFVAATNTAALTIYNNPQGYVHDEAQILFSNEANYPPYYNTNAAGEVHGFDYALLQLICEAVHADCALITSPWASLTQYPLMVKNPGDTYIGAGGIGLQQKWYHCRTGVGITPARARTMAFSNTYVDPAAYQIWLVGMNGATMAADASDVKVGVQGDSISATKFREFYPNAMEVVDYLLPADGIAALKAGEIHIFADQGLGFDDKTGYDPMSMTILEKKSLGLDGVGFACVPDRMDLVEMINKGLDMVVKDGSYAKLCSQYKDQNFPCLPVNTVPQLNYGGNNAVTGKADIVIGLYLDFAPYQTIDPATHAAAGFDVEIMKMVCAHAGISCATTVAPWASMDPQELPYFSIPAGDRQMGLHYPGMGFLEQWFDCAPGISITPSRLLSRIFTDSYMNPSVFKGWFFGKPGATMSADASDVTVGIMDNWSAGNFFKATMTSAKGYKTFTTLDALFAAVDSGDVDVAFEMGSNLVPSGLWSEDAYPKLSEVDMGTLGLGFYCHPAKMDMVKKLNEGLTKVVGTTEYMDVCKKHFAESFCMTAPESFTGNKISKSTDIIIGMYTDWAPYQSLDGFEIVGMDMEMTNMICEAAGIECAIITAPWASISPTAFPSLGITQDSYLMSYNYPGLGYLGKMFDCAPGCGNTVARRQSRAMSDPYLDPEAYAGWFIGKPGTTMEADASDVSVGLMDGWAAGTFFTQNYPNVKEVKMYTDIADAFADLDSGAIHVFFEDNNNIKATALYTADAYPTVQSVSIGMFGVGFMCHPARMDIVNKLNEGLKKILTEDFDKYKTACEKYMDPNLCLKQPVAFTGNRLKEKADITIGMYADWPPYQSLTPGNELDGLDVEITEAACAHSGAKCAIIMTPGWQSIVPSSFPSLDLASLGSVQYPGAGFLNKWFHCAPGAGISTARAQSRSYTNSYLDPKMFAAWFIGMPGAIMEADASDVIVGLMKDWAAASYFESNYKNAKGMKHFLQIEDAFAALKAGEIHVFFEDGNNIKSSPLWDADAYELLDDTVRFGLFGLGMMCGPGMIYNQRNKINEGLHHASMKSDGMFKAIQDKYKPEGFDVMVSPWNNPDDTKSYYATAPKCADLKDAYGTSECCGNPEKAVMKSADMAFACAGM